MKKFNPVSTAGKNKIDNLMTSADRKIIDEHYVPKERNELEQQILELKKRAQKNVWLMGQRLDEILQKKLYLEEKDKTGNSVFNSFDEYVEAKFDFQSTTAYNYVKIFRTIKLQPVGVAQPVEVIDYSKLVLITGIDNEEKRNELIKSTIEENLSKRVLQNRINEYKKSIVGLDNENKSEKDKKQESIKTEAKNVKVDFDESEKEKIISIKIPKEYENIYDRIIKYLKKLSIEQNKS